MKLLKKWLTVVGVSFSSVILFLRYCCLANICILETFSKNTFFYSVFWNCPNIRFFMICWFLSNSWNMDKCMCIQVFTFCLIYHLYNYILYYVIIYDAAVNTKKSKKADFLFFRVKHIFSHHFFLFGFRRVVHVVSTKLRSKQLYFFAASSFSFNLGILVMWRAYDIQYYQHTSSLFVYKYDTGLWLLKEMFWVLKHFCL